MEDRQTENLHLTPEMEFLQMGYRINHLIGLIESLYKKDIQERDRELLSKVVFELKSSGNPDFRNHFDSIRELYTFNHLCQVIKAP